MIPPDSARAAEPDQRGPISRMIDNAVAKGWTHPALTARAAESEGPTPVRFALMYDGRVAGIWSTREGVRKACNEWNAARSGYTIEPLYTGSQLERLRAEVAAARACLTEAERVGHDWMMLAITRQTEINRLNGWDKPVGTRLPETPT